MRDKALQYHSNNGIGNGKIEVIPKVKVDTREELSLAYTPGVAIPCMEIHNNPEKIYDYTIKENTVMVVSDGSAVLGLGNIGPAASIPVMEGKALLFKIFGGVDAYPLIIDSQDTEKIIETVKSTSLIAGGINLEDISAPRCFEIENRLSEELDIPIFHDDQHGTAVVSLAGLINALKITNKKIDEIKIVINGAGAAGVAIAKLMLTYGAKNIIVADTKGAVYYGRSDNMNPSKEELARITNPDRESGELSDIMRGADVFLGVSVKDAISAEMIKSMNRDAIVFAMANPDPEILPDIAVDAGAAVVATGRSDFPNQVNNVLGFPGIFRGLLDVRAKKVTDNMKIAASLSIAGFVKENDLDRNKIIPSVYEFEVFAYEAQAVASQAVKDGVARLEIGENEVFNNTLRVLNENQRRFFNK